MGKAEFKYGLFIFTRTAAGNPGAGATLFQLAFESD